MFYSPKKMSIVYFKKKKMSIVITEHSFSVNVDMQIRAKKKVKILKQFIKQRNLCHVIFSTLT